MSSKGKKQKIKETKELILLSFTKKTILINDMISYVYVGIVDNDSIFLRLTDYEKANYEAIYFLEELKKNITDCNNDIKSIYERIINTLFNQYKFNYSKDIFFNYSTFIPNTGQVIQKKLDLYYIENEDDLCIIKNTDSLKLLKEFNEQYKCRLTLNDPIVSLSSKCINNQGFNIFCELCLNASILSFEKNKISDLTPLNNNKFNNFKNYIWAKIILKA